VFSVLWILRSGIGEELTQAKAESFDPDLIYGWAVSSIIVLV
jgi:hypothetical protein